MEKEKQSPGENEIRPERLLIERDGKDHEVNAYTLVNAAKVVGKTYRGLRIILDNRRKAGQPITLWKPPMGRGQYILEEDLKFLMRSYSVEVKPEEEEEEK